MLAISINAAWLMIDKVMKLVLAINYLRIKVILVGTVTKLTTVIGPIIICYHSTNH